VVQWPLFQGLRRGAELDAAQAQVREAELQTEQLRQGVRLEYERAQGELEQARAQIAAATRTVAQAERVYELTELRYTEGLATQLDVSDARLALQQARMNQATAYHDFHLALARAERALGVSLIDAP
jgi:outer membrane protein TolC